MSEFNELRRRIEELETSAAFREDLHQRLNDVVARQDRELERLRNKVAALARRVLELGDSLPGADSGEDEAPPHY